jgi:hypothetical protein
MPAFVLEEKNSVKTIRIAAILMSTSACLAQTAMHDRLGNANYE